MKLTNDVLEARHTDMKQSLVIVLSPFIEATDSKCSHHPTALLQSGPWHNADAVRMSPTVILELVTDRAAIVAAILKEFQARPRPFHWCHSLQGLSKDLVREGVNLMVMAYGNDGSTNCSPCSAPVLHTDRILLITAAHDLLANRLVVADRVAFAEAEHAGVHDRFAKSPTVTHSSDVLLQSVCH